MDKRSGWTLLALLIVVVFGPLAVLVLESVFLMEAANFIARRAGEEELGFLWVLFVVASLNVLFLSIRTTGMFEDRA